ncbi:MAG TPA: hypothetical protein VLQ79_01600 [Myxococcaceae bacterium]|nr:hypothetical protein [Myxococcaceae bacterium]
MAWVYRVWVLAALALFAWGSVSGRRMFTPALQRIDPSVRSSPGGYRSYHFWHSGFSGGK